MTQREYGAGARPLWLRVAALFCVLLVSVAGVAQAAHLHGKWLPDSSAQAAAHSAQSAAAGEEGCPLCVAMHSALPMAALGALVVALLLAINLLLASTQRPRAPWNFAAFSRPPPFVLS